MIKISEFSKWMTAKYPYDSAECGHCATLHGILNRCQHPEHAEMRADAAKIPTELRSTDPAKFREIVLAFREKFTRFYPKWGQGSNEN